MKSWRERIVSVLTVALGAVWFLAALSKMSEPLAAYEFASYVVAPGPPAKALLVVAVLCEMFLGAGMVTGLITRLGWSLGALAAAEAALFVARHRAAGELVRCGCFGGLEATTVEEALVRNGILAAVHVMGMVLAYSARRATAQSPADG